MKIRYLSAAVVFLAGASPLAAQSLFNAAGLGIPVEALDGRARALGNLGIGLDGGSFMPTDPGALGRLGISTGVMVAQPSWTDYSADGGATGQFQGNRFPLLGIAYPVLSGMMSVQVGSFLDQEYEALNSGTIDVGTGPIETNDVFRQDGSISNLNVGFSRMVGSAVSLGLMVGRYAGSLDRTLTRTYGSEGVATNVDPYIEAGVWSWVGHSFTAGATADVGSILRVAASVQVPTDLDAEASEETRGDDRTFDLPTQYRVGATAALTPSLKVTGSMALADWSSAGNDLIGSSFAHNANGFGVGLELSRARLWGKDAPLRFGFRRTGLPFSFDDDRVDERILSAGFGLALNRTNNVVLAGVDLAVERGRRTGAGLTENFWRATLSLLASGF
jgi:hypothetical protein